MSGKWMAEIHYRTPIDPDGTIMFGDFAELGRLIDQANAKRHADWHDIETVTITLNRSTRPPQKEPEPADDPDAEMLDDHARRGANDDETD